MNSNYTAADRLQVSNGDDVDRVNGWRTRDRTQQTTESVHVTSPRLHGLWKSQSLNLSVMDALDDAVNDGDARRDDAEAEGGDADADRVPSSGPTRLETLCVDAYLRYLEREAHGYVNLVLTNSRSLKGKTFLIVCHNAL